MSFLLRDRASQMYLAVLGEHALVLEPSRAMIFIDDADIARARVPYPSNYERVELAGAGKAERGHICRIS